MEKEKKNRMRQAGLVMGYTNLWHRHLHKWWHAGFFHWGGVRSPQNMQQKSWQRRKWMGFPQPPSLSWSSSCFPALLGRAEAHTPYQLHSQTPMAQTSVMPCILNSNLREREREHAYWRQNNIYVNILSPCVACICVHIITNTHHGLILIFWVYFFIYFST